VTRMYLAEAEHALLLTMHKPCNHAVPTRALGDGCSPTRVCATVPPVCVSPPGTCELDVSGERLFRVRER
jgi:hypothetical protein